MNETLHTLLTCTGLDAAKVVSAAAMSLSIIAVAYVRHPWYKALILTLPIPFTCAYVTSGLPVGPMHMFGLIVSVAYHWLVYLLVRGLRLPLLAAIVIAALGYIALNAGLRPWVAPLPFLALVVAEAVVFAVGVWRYRPGQERLHRSATRWWVKLPVIFALALSVFGLTGVLGGAVTTFPYAGVFASYELRHSLRLLAGQYTVNVVAIAAMIAVMWGVQGAEVPAWGALALGWLTVLVCGAALWFLRLGMPGETGEKPAADPEK